MASPAQSHPTTHNDILQHPGAQPCARTGPVPLPGASTPQPATGVRSGVAGVCQQQPQVPMKPSSLKRRAPSSGRAPGLEPTPVSPSEPLFVAVAAGNGDGVASTGVTGKRQRVGTNSPSTATPAPGLAHTHTTNVIMVTPHLFAALQHSMMQHKTMTMQQAVQQAQAAVQRANVVQPLSSSPALQPSTASEAKVEASMRRLPAGVTPLEPAAIMGRPRSSSIEVASPRPGAASAGSKDNGVGATTATTATTMTNNNTNTNKGADGVSMALPLPHVLHSPPQAGSPPRAAVARFARAAMEGAPCATRPLLLQKKATKVVAHPNTTAMPPPPTATATATAAATALPSTAPVAAPRTPLLTFNPSVSGPSAAEMEAANTLRSLRAAPVARWQLEGVQAAVAGSGPVPTSAPQPVFRGLPGPFPAVALAPAAAPRAPASAGNTQPSSGVRATTVGATTAAAAAAAATTTTTTAAAAAAANPARPRRRPPASYTDPSDEDDGQEVDDGDDDDYREGEDDRPWLPRRTHTRPSALRRGGRPRAAAPSTATEVHVPVVTHSTPVRSRKPRVVDGSPAIAGYTSTGFRVPPPPAAKKSGPRPGRRALVLSDGTPAPAPVVRRRPAASPSKQRHDLRIRVAARGVVYIFGRAMASRTLWWVGSDLVRFALLDRNVISPTFKFKLPNHKAALSEAAQHPAVRDVVLRALDLESRLKKPTGTRARVKLDDTEEVMDAFKSFVEQQARLLNITE